MKTNEARTRLHDLAAGLLDDTTAAQVRSQIDADPALKKEYDAACAYVSALRSAAQLKAPDDFLAGVRNRINRPENQPLWSKLFRPFHVKLPFELAGLAATIVVVVIVTNPFKKSTVDLASHSYEQVMKEDAVASSTAAAAPKQHQAAADDGGPEKKPADGPAISPARQKPAAPAQPVISDHRSRSGAEAAAIDGPLPAEVAAAADRAAEREETEASDIEPPRRPAAEEYAAAPSFSVAVAPAAEKKLQAAPPAPSSRSAETRWERTAAPRSQAKAATSPAEESAEPASGSTAVLQEQDDETGRSVGPAMSIVVTLDATQAVSESTARRRTFAERAKTSAAAADPVTECIKRAGATIVETVRDSDTTMYRVEIDAAGYVRLVQELSSLGSVFAPERPVAAAGAVMVRVKTVRR